MDQRQSHGSRPDESRPDAEAGERTNRARTPPDAPRTTRAPTADFAGALDAPDAERAVAAAALVVAQHPDGESACSNYGPSEPLREFPADLRTLAIDALDQAVAEQSELAELWGETADGPKWRHGTRTRVWQASAVRRARCPW
ncbi:DUF4259 domain-containing protein [Streptomyces sp. NPDC001792]|uniref:DUF4259 domain-containing protein n=1 Tax=Streptomyces sp. NPDC001792 TaxID=3154524 RepID=UPI003328FCFA